jgi:hypothetical protein
LTRLFGHGERIKFGFIPNEKHFFNRQAEHPPRVSFVI